MHMWRQQDNLETAGNKILQQDCHASPWFCRRGDVRVHLHHQDLSAWLQGLRHWDVIWIKVKISDHLASWKLFEHDELSHES